MHFSSARNLPSYFRIMNQQNSINLFAGTFVSSQSASALYEVPQRPVAVASQSDSALN
jgi:hypothetical protein